MKGLKCFSHYRKLFITLAVLFVPFYLLLKSTNVSAVSVTSVLSSQSSFTKNFDSTLLYQTLGSGSIPRQVLGTDANMTGLWDYSLNFVFTNPVSPHSGTGFSHSIYFTLSSNGNFVNTNLPNLMANARLTFEGVNTSSSYCTSNFGIYSLTSNSVRFRISSSCPAGSYGSNQNFQNVLAVVNYKPESLFWCANDSERPCPSNPVYVTLSDVQYTFELLQSNQDSANQTIINQNQTIINQNQQQIDRDNQDRQDLENQVGDTSDEASGAAASVTSGFSPLTSVIGGFVNIILHPPQSDCVIDADLGHMDLGDIDLCQLSPPPAIQVISTLLIIGFTIPFAYSLILFLLRLLGNITEGS